MPLFRVACKILRNDGKELNKNSFIVTRIFVVVCISHILFKYSFTVEISNNDSNGIELRPTEWHPASLPML